jgi:hypothetical protein
MRIEVYAGEDHSNPGHPRRVGWLLQLPDGRILLEVAPSDGSGVDYLGWLRAAVMRSRGWPRLKEEPFYYGGIVLRNISGMIEGRLVPDEGDYHVIAREIMPAAPAAWPDAPGPDQPIVVPAVNRG